VGQFHKLADNEDGTTAVEFAIVSPIFIALVIGIMSLCLCLFLVGSLHFAVEEGARCASVRTTVCKDATTSVAYAQSHYYGPGSPTFTYATSACGNSVSASINYVAQLGLTQFTIPISATACFPWKAIPWMSLSLLIH
jgi:Flp pilus assembly protein TadG